MNPYNQSCSEDIAKLTKIALENEIFCQIVQTKVYDCKIKNKKNEFRKVSWQNTNKLLEKGFHGVKTGFIYSF